MDGVVSGLSSPQSSIIVTEKGKFRRGDIWVTGCCRNHTVTMQGRWISVVVIIPFSAKLQDPACRAYCERNTAQITADQISFGGFAVM